MPTAYLNIGSNIGDRRSFLERAVAGISTRRSNVRVSRPFESEPWGYDSPNMFLNIGVAFALNEDESVSELLAGLQAIEHTLWSRGHRTESGGYADRAVDIDIIAVDDMIIATEELVLPHPRMHLREFVMVPMMELAPNWVHPVFNQTCAQLLESLRCT